MSLPAIAVARRTTTVFTTGLLLLGGLLSFFGLGQLEDPEFTVKTAVVTTPYPGAKPAEVELEVTDRIELALQELPQLKELESRSLEGLSQIWVYIKPEYTSEALPQVWDELRKKVSDVRPELPPGTGEPVVLDDFGDVYGFLLAVVSDGFTYAELERYTDSIKKELSLVEGAARVELWGQQTECIYLDVSEARIAQLGLSMADVQRTLTEQNTVVDGGGVDVTGNRLRFEQTGEFSSPEDIADLVVRGQAGAGAGASELIRIRDFASVRRGYAEPASWEMRYDGLPAIGLSVSNVSGANIVDLGQRLDRKLDELRQGLPVGIELHEVSWQSDLVSQSISEFVVNLAEAVAIVLIVLWLSMGLRTALIVGLSGLVFTIVIGFVFMAIFGIDLQRMSLGALVIALGMMVDNAIVVADGTLVRIQNGVERVKAAVEAAAQPSWPLLGATVVAVMAFYPIMASEESAGEYCRSLFTVVAIALLLSWILSVTVAPVMCIAILPAVSGGQESEGRFYRIFRTLLEQALRARWLVLAGMVVLLIGSGLGFLRVDQMFFPASARAQMMIDYWAPEGTRIQQVSADLRALEQQLIERPEIDSIATFVGQGPPRFYLPVDPEASYASYGQLVVNTPDYTAVQELLAELQPWIDQNVPQATLILRKFGIGPYETWPVEARFSGPAVADPEVLRDLARQATDVMQASEHALVVRTDWRQRVPKVVLDYDERNARWTSVSRQHIADTTLRSFDGLTVGQYREDDKLLPILLRHGESERSRFASQIELAQVRTGMGQESVPMSQVTSSIEVDWEDPMIWRWDRRRAITVQGVPAGLATELRGDVLAGIEAIELPPGYTLEWEGEFRSSGDAQASLIPGMIPAFVIIALIVVALFNAYRPPLVIAAIIPFALIGITLGLLITGQPFGFVALLGAMSLGGMMIKNAIVLLDQINIEQAAGKTPYTAVVDSAVLRLRPVVLAAATTVLGVIPLLQDVFWVSMAVTIMFGLTVGTILTMIGVPVLYAIFFRLPSRPST